jgi:outer membrane protein OmpA-like peptidoglycan-associated protein
MRNFLKTCPRIFGLATATVLLLQGGVAAAEDLTETQIIRALTPSLTRSLSTRQGSANSRGDEAFIDSLRTQGTRSLSITERPKLDTVVAEKPTIDLPVEFEYNSYVLRGHAVEVVNSLGKALASPGLKDQTFLIMGHTDAKGSQEHNQVLSERRAGSVKQFLVQRFELKPENLIAVGYGKTHLKKPETPFAPENRRVQTVNMNAYKSAGQ